MRLIILYESVISCISFYQKEKEEEPQDVEEGYREMF